MSTVLCRFWCYRREDVKAEDHLIMLANVAVVAVQCVFVCVCIT